MTTPQLISPKRGFEVILDVFSPLLLTSIISSISSPGSNPLCLDPCLPASLLFPLLPTESSFPRKILIAYSFLPAHPEDSRVPPYLLGLLPKLHVFSQLHSGHSKSLKVFRTHHTLWPLCVFWHVILYAWTEFLLPFRPRASHHFSKLSFTGPPGQPPSTCW